MIQEIQEIHHAVIHKLQREGSAPSIIHPAPECLDNNDEALKTLIQDVHTIYAERQNKSYGEFDSERTLVSAEQHLLVLRDQDDADFYGLSLRLMALLKERFDPENFATGGHVLFFDFSASDTRWFVIAVVNSAPGTMVDDNFKVVRAPHLDVTGIRFAGRVNFPEWSAGNNRYISFLRGKKAEVSLYFQRFLGCTTTQQDLKDTQNLVNAIKKFAADQGLDDNVREELLSKVNRIARDKAERKESLDLGELANQVWPTDPTALKTAFSQANPPIADGFIPQKRGLDSLVRFKAKTDKWKLEFERGAIQDHTITYNADEKSVTIRNLTQDILAKLTEEFPPNAITDDSAT